MVREISFPPSEHSREPASRPPTNPKKRKKRKKRGRRVAVEQRCRCADAMRMAPGVPIRMVLGWLNTFVPSNPPECAGIMRGREVTYDSRRTGFTGAGAVEPCRRRAGRASFTKKKPDLTCRGRDLSPGVRRCAWCASWGMGVPRGACAVTTKVERPRNLLTKIFKSGSDENK